MTTQEKLLCLFRKAAPNTFQVLSDLHLEVGKQYRSFELSACAPYLILAGDTGRLIDYDLYREFLSRQTAKFNRIFLVLGNHEFYGISFAEGLYRARQLEEESTLDARLTLLQQDRFDIPGSSTTILGCTLWSKVPEDAKVAVKSTVSDFKHIQGWTVENHVAAHELDVAWLESQIADIQEHQAFERPRRTRKILVITHHALSMQETAACPRDVQNPLASAFATDLDRKRMNVKTWIFGHTHFNTELKNAESKF